MAGSPTHILFLKTERLSCSCEWGGIPKRLFWVSDKSSSAPCEVIKHTFCGILCNRFADLYATTVTDAMNKDSESSFYFT